MDKLMKIEKCRNFYNNLSNILKDYGYVVVGSCNQDISSYLIPIGTEDKISYYEKPFKSFRLSDHWNWYANVNKCSKEHYVQCLSVDAPWARKRFKEGGPSKPIFAIQVCVFGSDEKYHHVYGEKFDRKTKTWSWIESDPNEIAKHVLEAL